ncbi:MAG: beta-lactamase family protein [Chloracidobacterium sp.]|nr:beta-lactamase family protein [Chloracidobacterium sp.]
MKLRSIINLAILLVVMAAGLQSSHAQAPFQGFDDYVNKAMKEWDVPGMAIAIVKDDKVVYAKGYGLREMGKTAPVDEHTIFAIGSSSKAFTATSIGMLVDDKKLKWDDRVSQYLPSFQLFDPYVTRNDSSRSVDASDRARTRRSAMVRH